MKLISAYSSQTTINDLGTTSIGTILSLNLLSALNAAPKLSLLAGVSTWLRSPLNQSYSIGVASAGTQRGIRTTSLAALAIESSRICHLLLMLLLPALTILSIASLEAPASLALASVPPLGVTTLEPLHALSSEPLMNTATPASGSWKFRPNGTKQVWHCTARGGRSRQTLMAVHSCTTKKTASWP